MVRTFLVRGMLVGIVAGLLSFGFLKVYGEPQVDRAIAFETQQDEAKAAAQKAESHSHASASMITRPQMADHEEPEPVSRSVQAGLGLFVAILVYSTAFGGLFGLAFAFAYGRARRVDAASSFGPVGGHWLCCHLSGAQFEIPGQSASGRQP